MNSKNSVSEKQPLAEESPESRIDRLGELLERNRVRDYVMMMENTRSLFWKNFIIGIARGLGMGLGLTFLVAVLLYILLNVLQTLVSLNIPVIGNFIADLVKIVQTQMQVRP